MKNRRSGFSLGSSRAEKAPMKSTLVSDSTSISLEHQFQSVSDSSTSVTFHSFISRPGSSQKEVILSGNEFHKAGTAISIVVTKYLLISLAAPHIKTSDIFIGIERGRVGKL